MGRKRKPNLEIEYELEREIEDLKKQIDKLKKLLQDKNKDVKIFKVEKSIEKTRKYTCNECPKCGAEVSITELPMGFLELCKSACGFRAVKKKG